MKKKYLKWIGLMAMLCIIGMIFMGASENSETASVKRLLEKRTTIMENVLFGKITYEEGKNQLKQVEKDKLYSDDLEALARYENTDLESVKDMEITHISKESRIYDIMTFRCSIKWIIAGVSETTEEKYDYIVGVDVNGGEYRLVSFEIKK